ncbi:cation:proton antiporter [Ornithinicoccus hortensis]|uniref:Sodium/proton antiporter (CPA1 family) n=1 Tax=Ornithinicoccus hortensis TaxID=82346 RepID=A0A542YTS2_9MICO|nr:cation:proton antiporter [Ornithinicoccus hortensis]TQL51493.1 sodium/proton antiporter (CPA1 family) [Ornithinicoccus hortensis]
MEFLPMILLVTATVGLTAVARHFLWPAPLLVTGVALVVAGIPGLPAFTIDSHVILTLVLPPLLYSAALDVSLLNFTRSRKHISRLGVGLVAVTAGVVGIVGYLLVPDMTLPAALLLGAIVAPPDAVSAAAIGRRLGLPRHVMTVLSGESLINDAASLTLFKVFLLIIGGTSLTVLDDLGIFVTAVLVGVLVGLVLGVVFHWIRMRIDDPVVETMLGLLVPFLAYIGAEEMQGSGVLAVVAAGLWIGFNSPKTGYAARITERPVWSAIDLLLESFVFALIGLQMKPIAEALDSSGRGVWNTVWIAVVVLIVVILIRPAFIFGTYHLSRFRSNSREQRRVRAVERASRRVESRNRPPRVPKPLGRKLLQAEPEMTWQELTVLSWTSMRGVVTLAAAAAVPVVTDSGNRVPGHDVIIFVAFFVTIGTLLLQGLTLPFVIRRLGVTDPEQDKRDREQERALLRITITESVEYLETHRDELTKTFDGPLLDRLLKGMRQRIEWQEQESRLEAQEDRQLDRRGLQYRGELRRKMLRRQRDVLVRERDKGSIDEEVMREVLKGLDAEELALDTSILHWDRA